MTAVFALLKAVPLWLYVALAMAGALAYQQTRVHHWGRQVDQRDIQIARMKTDVATDLASASETARIQERGKALDAERIANATDQQIAAAADRAAGAERAASGLRGEIARLNRRPGPAANPGAASFAGEASVARELLGSCSTEYTGLAAEADGLRIQVMGLQDFAVGPAGAGK